MRRGPRGGAGLLLGSGLVLMTFDLLNKQTYLNQWWLACVLVVAGLALQLGVGPPAPSTVDRHLGVPVSGDAGQNLGNDLVRR